MASAGSVLRGPPGLAGQIPVTAVVRPFAWLRWHDCLFGRLRPGQCGQCSAELAVTSNADVWFRITISPLQNGTKLIPARYTIRLPDGRTATLEPNEGEALDLAQRAAPLDTVTRYPITGVARNASGHQTGGLYQAQIQVLVMAEATPGGHGHDGELDEQKDEDGHGRDDHDGHEHGHEPGKGRKIGHERGHGGPGEGEPRCP